jgi:alanyl-tRNA synthetase
MVPGQARDGMMRSTKEIAVKSSELREKYLAFFEAKGCKRWPSSSLIPDDPSLLLTSAGMVQFKPYFLQQKQLEAPYVGTTTVQKCVRTTDIDIIGTTGRHLSFFEMLGNFAFGAYFKKEMCTWAYEFSTEVLGFDPARLYFTVFLDDDETVEIGNSRGVPESLISRLGEKDHFWRAGPTGPCGPCSELYYDQGEEFGCGSPDCAPGCDCDRFLEYWNCVFTQYDGQEDGSLVELPKKNIDTGMGLERTAAILQGVQSNYDTDILRGLIAVGERLSGNTYGGGGTVDLGLRIIADHSRAVTFMIGDGILPSNEGRGYVLRRLLRRAMRYGHLLNIPSPFLQEYVEAVIAEMGDVYPEIRENQSLIERIVRAEEERFSLTLHQGQNYLDQALTGLAEGAVLDGETAFILHDRYGFPIELTVEIASEHAITVDQEEFERHMTDQRERARAAAKGDAWAEGSAYDELLALHGPTAFTGYDANECTATVLAVIEAGDAVEVVLDRTPFYGEMGGQVGDTGTITGQAGTLTVTDTKIHDQIFALVGTLEGAMAAGDSVTAAIDVARRQRIERNHTATHLLHHALQEVLGPHIKQAGSLVAPGRLRFDFTHFEAVTPAQLAEVEDLVNRLIAEDAPVTSHTTTLDEARASGVTALFGEKYGEQVRVLEAGPASRELCGGTHVTHTAQIGLLKITGESSVGSNLRRIEAVTSLDAIAWVNRQQVELAKAAALLKSAPLEVADKIAAQTARIHHLEEEITREKKAAAASNSAELAANATQTAAGIRLVVTRIDGMDVEGLRNAWDGLHKALGDGGAVVLGSVTPAGSPLLLAAGTPAAVAAGFDAGAIIKQCAPLIKGGGGGKPSMAQAGGKDAAGLDGALQAAREMLV